MFMESTTLLDVEVLYWGKDVVHGGGRDERGPGLECIRVHNNYRLKSSPKLHE